MNKLILDNNKKYLLACSFGVDSMALFHMLKSQNYNFSVAHVNYHLRDESDEEERKLRKYCLDNNIDIYVYDNKEKIKSNIEGACREIRYNFFKKIVEENSFDELVVAHHQDDLIETYLLQKKRGILSSWYGIKFSTLNKGIKVVRPLLKFTKKELIQYNEQNNVPYALDLSNLEDKFIRNKIRHNVIEKLKREDRENILVEIANKNRELVDIFSHLNKINLNETNNLLNLDFISFQYALNMLLKNSNLYCPISKKTALSIKHLLLSKKPNVTLKINGDICFEKSYGYCYFISSSFSHNYRYEILDENVNPINDKYFYFDVISKLKERDIKLDNFPLFVLNIDMNDIYKIDNFYVNLNRLVIDWKMPLLLRKIWPVVVNNKNEIIYIPRYRKDCKETQKQFFYLKNLFF